MPSAATTAPVTTALQTVLHGAICHAHAEYCLCISKRRQLSAVPRNLATPPDSYAATTKRLHHNTLEVMISSVHGNIRFFNPRK